MATLVTGGAGYVGSHTVVTLHDSGREVVVLDDFSAAPRRTVDALRSLTLRSLRVVEADAADAPAVDAVLQRHEIDSVIHFAALKSAPESLADPIRYYSRNLASTMVLAEACARHGVRRFVFSSSAAVYGTPATLPVTEEAPAAPQSPYGASKQMCERILADTAAAVGGQAVMLRYFNPVGAHPSGRLGEDPLGTPENLVPRVMQTLLALRGPVPVFGSDYDTRDGTAVRDYVHVMDVAEAHTAVLDAALGERSSRAYNVGTGRGSTVLEVLAAASQAAGRPVPHEMRGRRPGDAAAIWADCARAARELRWTPRRGLQEMLDDHWSFARSQLAREAL